MNILKSIFFIAVALNLMAFFCAAGRFLITLPPPHTVGDCKANALTQAAHEASISMQNFLIPAAAWLAGIVLVNLAIAGVVIYRKPKTM